MNLAELSTSQVVDLLQYLKLPQYKRLFAARSIDGAALAMCHRLDNVLRLGLSHDDAVELFYKIQEYNRHGVPQHIAAVTTPTTTAQTSILAELTPSECIHLLHHLHLSQYAPQFTENHVDGAALALCHNIKNVHKLGITNATDAQKLLDVIHDYNILGVPFDHHVPTTILAELSPKQVLSLLHHHHLIKYAHTVINKDIDGAALALCHRLSQVKKLGFANDTDAARVFQLIEVYNQHGVPVEALRHTPIIAEAKPLAALNIAEVQLLLSYWNMNKYIRLASERCIDGACLAMVHTATQLSHLGFLTSDIPLLLQYINEYNETEVPLSILDDTVITDNSKLLSELTEKEVHQLLIGLDLDNYISALKSQHQFVVDGAYLAMCHRPQQLTRLGISTYDAQLLMNKIHEWNTLGVSENELSVPSTPLAELTIDEVCNIFHHIGLSDFEANIRHYSVDGAALAMCHRIENLHQIGITTQCDFILSRVAHYVEYDVPNKLLAPISTVDAHKESAVTTLIPLAQLRVAEVVRLFYYLKLPQYVELVRNRNIDGAALAMCHRKDNLIALGITSPHDVEHLLSVIQRLLIRDVASYMLETNDDSEKLDNCRYIRDLNTDETIRLLHHLSLPQYEAVFKRNHVSGTLLQACDMRQLIAMGVARDDADYLLHKLDELQVVPEEIFSDDIHDHDVKALHGLSVYDVLKLLDYLGLKQYKRAFVRDNVDGAVLSGCVTESDIQALGVKSGPDANFLLEKVKEYKEHGVPLMQLEVYVAEGKSPSNRK